MIDEDFKLFKEIKRKPINNCVDLSKHMIGRRNGFIYFTEKFRIDFENKMYDNARLISIIETFEKENKKLKKQAKISAEEFEKCLNIKEKMIDIFIEDLLAYKYDFDITKQDMYREYENKAIKKLMEDKYNED